MRNPSIPILALTALLGLGCAQLPQLSSGIVAALKSPPLELDARGPGSVFDSVEAATVDALKFCYLQAREAGDMERMRAGTIERSGAGYTYRDIHVANPRAQRKIEYMFAPRDVARFHVYPRHRDRRRRRRALGRSANPARSRTAARNTGATRARECATPVQFRPAAGN